MTTIRRLDKGEAMLFRDLRLEALQDAPEAFCSTYADAIKRSEESWVKQADASASGDDRATFIAVNKKPIGIAAIYRIDDSQSDAELLQMWVAPEHRGNRTAEKLIDAVANWASDNQISRIVAEVIPKNNRAINFYQKVGFEPIENKDPDDSNLLFEMNLA